MQHQMSILILFFRFIQQQYYILVCIHFLEQRSPDSRSSRNINNRFILMHLFILMCCCSYSNSSYTSNCLAQWFHVRLYTKPYSHVPLSKSAFSDTLLFVKHESYSETSVPVHCLILVGSLKHYKGVCCFCALHKSLIHTCTLSQKGPVDGRAMSCGVRTGKT